MQKENAMQILRIKNENMPITKEEIEHSYQRMLPRYPPEKYPEKSLEFRSAYNLLINNDKYWKDFLKQPQVDLSEFSKFILFDEVKRDFEQEINSIIEGSSPRYFLDNYSKTILSNVCQEMI